MSYSKHLSSKKTPQSQPIPGSDQVANSAGGYSFEVAPLDRLMRFLILGSEGGSYYATEQTLTVENAKNVIKLIKSEGLKVVETVVAVSDSGRAAKNNAAIFVLALCASFGDQATKEAAYAGIPKVCRIGTHLFEFCEAVNNLRGWSRGLRNGVAKYYTYKSAKALALDLIKYRQREGWTHRDVLRLAHVKAEAYTATLLGYAVNGKVPENDVIQAFEQVQQLKATKDDIKAAVELIENYELPREALPTDLLNSKEIWSALLTKMPLTALIRNLGKMTAVGVFDSNLSASVKLAVKKLTDAEAIKKARIHPLNVLQARATYGSGGGYRGKLTWSPVTKLMDALDETFYLAFSNVEATGKNYLLALDCSGSMSTPVANSSLDCRTASAALALVTARTEANVEIVGFTNGSYPSMHSRSGYNSGITPLPISAKMDLGSVVKTMEKVNFGGTDCALPMLYAIEKKLMVDVFIIYTDSETWAGSIHPAQALKEYRKKFNPNARLIVMGMASSGFTIADPSDKGMLDVVGFDTATPTIISEFANGNF